MAAREYPRSQPVPPKMSYGGSQHRETRVTTNSFRISQLPTREYMQYDIVIEPEVNIPRRRRELILEMQNQNSTLFHQRAIYDGKKILYSPARIPLPSGDTGTLDVTLGQGPRGKFKIRLSSSNRITFSQIEQLMRGDRVDAAVPINLIQMLLRQAPALLHPTKGRSVFSNKDQLDLGSGVIMLRGFFQSVRVIPRQLVVNVDVANATFYKPGVLTDVALDILPQRERNIRTLSLRPTDRKYMEIYNTLLRHFKRLQIKVPKVSNNIRIIRGIEPNAGLFHFEKEPGHFMTVEEYYMEAYNIRLQRPQEFGVILSQPSDANKTIVPFELCEIVPGQLYKRKLAEFQTREMVRATTQRPNERLNSILSAVGQHPNSILQYTRSDFLLNAGIRVEDSPLTVSGRMLMPPSITYGKAANGRVESSRPNGGKWNMIEKKLFMPASIGDWAIINMSNLEPKKIEMFISNLRSCCTTLGMGELRNRDGSPPKISFGAFNPQSFRDHNDIQKAVAQIHQSKPQMVLVILNKSDADTKVKVKQFGDLRSLIITQCVREDKFSQNLHQSRAKSLNQYCNNVALKINARLGGINCVMPLPGLKTDGSDDFMIMGADVSHPPGGSVIDRPSVASLVYSVDQYGCQYQAQHAVLPPRTEMMTTELSVMVKEAIVRYGRKNNKPVKRIIFYRDGVSEGEFDRVAQGEIDAIMMGVRESFEAYSKATGNALPRPPTITFIVVTKRHHVRFFPQNQNDTDESSNLKAGFATDGNMSTPGLREFYLLSHGGLLGTSRPSHYIVLRDDNFNGDVPLIQELSFALCHVYAKATRSVSIPAPVYYADLACTRASIYFDSSLRFGEEESTAESRSNRRMREDFDIEKWKKGFTAPSGDISRSMYFI